MTEYRYKLPDVGEGVVEAEIVEWRVKVGDTVVEDQPVLDVMTDKATVEVPCAVNGKVTKIVGEPGDVIPVGTEILFIETDAATAAAAKEEEAEAPKAIHDRIDICQGSKRPPWPSLTFQRNPPNEVRCSAKQPAEKVVLVNRGYTRSPVVTPTALVRGEPSP